MQPSHSLSTTTPWVPATFLSYLEVRKASCVTFLLPHCLLQSVLQTAASIIVFTCLVLWRPPMVMKAESLECLGWVWPISPCLLHASHTDSCWGHQPHTASAFSGLTSWDTLSPDSTRFPPSPMTLMKYHLLQEDFPDHPILSGPYQPPSEPLLAPFPPLTLVPHPLPAALPPPICTPTTTIRERSRLPPSSPLLDESKDICLLC